MWCKVQTSGGNCGVVVSEKNKALFWWSGEQKIFEIEEKILVFPKRVNFVPEAVSVWSRERYVSIPVNIDALFQVYNYFYNKYIIKCNNYYFIISINILKKSLYIYIYILYFFTK